MIRRNLLLGAALAGLAACGPAPTAIAPDGKPIPKVYTIKPNMTNKVYFNLLDSVNSLRQARGLPPVQLNAELNAAAATHARDMSVQNRPWHFGSDGSSPLSRVQRAGYRGQLGGELISETYETELDTLAAWMADIGGREVILAPAANELGFAWWQEPNGKIWWALLTGTAGGTAYQGVTPRAAALIPSTSVFSN